MCAVQRIGRQQSGRNGTILKDSPVSVKNSVGGGSSYLIGENDLLRRGLFLHRVGIGNQLLGQFAVSAQTGAGGNQLADDDILLQATR